MQIPNEQMEGLAFDSLNAISYFDKDNGTVMVYEGFEASQGYVYLVAEEPQDAESEFGEDTEVLAYFDNADEANDFAEKVELS